MGLTELVVQRFGDVENDEDKPDAKDRRLPQVAECAVVGAPDETWGQRVTVVAVPRGERLPLATLRDALREALPASALPRAVRWVDAMPLTGPGKHDRGALRRLATEPDEVA